MSRISSRVATISAVLGIILLVILLVILWSNVRNVDRIGDVGQTRNDSTVERIVDEARERQIDSAMRITTTLDSIEQNFTNTGESYFYLFVYYLLDNFDKSKLHFKSLSEVRNKWDVSARFKCTYSD